jgi:enoyl-CoA hydratase/carnithine racemase
MSTRFDSALRETLERISTVPAPSGLADAAIRRAGRQRARRMALTAAAVAVAAVVALPLAVAAVPSGRGEVHRPARRPPADLRSPAERGS